MKICLIHNLYKPYNRGGAEQVVETTAKGLSKLGHQVFIITTKPYFAKEPNEVLGVKIFRLRSLYYNLAKIPKFLRLFWHFWDMFDAVGYFKIKKLIKKIKPDLVITHNLKGLGYLTPLVFNRLKIRHRHILHDIQLLHPSGLLLYGQEKKLTSGAAKIYIFFNRYFFSKIETVVSPSSWLLKEHEKRNFFLKSRKKVLPNPIVITKQKKEKYTRSKDFKILYVGQVEKYKGAGFLVDVFLRHKKDLSGCVLFVVGGGVEFERIKKQAEKQDRIKILGKQENEKVKKLMEEADLLAVPSFCYENSPTVIYEAAAAGLPVIASRLGGIIALVRGFGGILFKPGDEKDFLKKIKWAKKNPAWLEEISRQSRLKAENRGLDLYLTNLLKNKNR